MLAKGTKGPGRKKAEEAASRKDPRPRPLSGLEPFGTVVNRDPGYHYVLANQGDDYLGADYYYSIGYDLVTYDGKDGPRMAGCRSNELGQPITARGHVLMACPMERYQEIQQYGANGDGGRELVNAQEARMMTKSGTRFRGVINPRLGSVEATREHDFGSVD